MSGETQGEVDDVKMTTPTDSPPAEKEGSEPIACINIQGPAGSLTTEQLRAAFSPFGHILGVLNKKTLTTAYAFVQFENRPQAERAKNTMHNEEIHGHKAIIKWAKYNMPAFTAAASGTVDPGDNRICKYFLQGKCAKGMDCPYFHPADIEVPPPSTRKKAVCKFWKPVLSENKCKLGSICPYVHDGAKRTTGRGQQTRPAAPPSTAPALVTSAPLSEAGWTCLHCRQINSVHALRCTTCSMLQPMYETRKVEEYSPPGPARQQPLVYSAPAPAAAATAAPQLPVWECSRCGLANSLAVERCIDCDMTHMILPSNRAIPDDKRQVKQVETRMPTPTLLTTRKEPKKIESCVSKTYLVAGSAWNAVLALMCKCLPDASVQVARLSELEAEMDKQRVKCADEKTTMLWRRGEVQAKEYGERKDLHERSDHARIVVTFHLAAKLLHEDAKDTDMFRLHFVECVHRDTWDRVALDLVSLYSMGMHDIYGIIVALGPSELDNPFAIHSFRATFRGEVVIAVCDNPSKTLFDRAQATANHMLGESRSRRVFFTGHLAKSEIVPLLHDLLLSPPESVATLTLPPAAVEALKVHVYKAERDVDDRIVELVKEYDQASLEIALAPVVASVMQTQKQLTTSASVSRMLEGKKRAADETKQAREQSLQLFAHALDKMKEPCDTTATLVDTEEQMAARTMLLTHAVTFSVSVEKILLPDLGVYEVEVVLGSTFKPFKTTDIPSGASLKLSFTVEGQTFCISVRQHGNCLFMSLDQVSIDLINRFSSLNLSCFSVTVFSPTPPARMLVGPHPTHFFSKTSSLWKQIASLFKARTLTAPAPQNAGDDKKSQKSPAAWSVDQVAEWVASLALPASCNKTDVQRAFKDSQIDGSVLFEVEDSILQHELGIAAKIPRLIIRKEISKLALQAASLAAEAKAAASQSILSSSNLEQMGQQMEGKACELLQDPLFGALLVHLQTLRNFLAHQSAAPHL